MSAALELIRAVEANGGCFRVDGDYLVIAPGEAAAPVMEELRQHKAELLAELTRRPSDEKFEESTGCEPPKPSEPLFEGFEGSALPLVPELRLHESEIIALLQSRTKQEPEPEPDGDALGLWMLARCVYRDRCWGGVGALHLDLSRWCADCGRPVPASRRAFVMALQAEGFEVTTDGFVYGLMLARDLVVYERYQAAPEASTR